MSRLTSYPNQVLRGWRVGDGELHPATWYRTARRFTQLMICMCCQFRAFNRRYEPPSGGVVYVCNHQSFLDPLLIGCSLRRPMHFMARDSLFRGPFGAMIRSVNAFPVKRGTADVASIKRAMQRVRDGGQVLVFAEGTRTPNGRIGEFMPGVAMLSQRAADWTVPVLIDGAFEAWPRGRMMPLPSNIVVQYGKPISRDEARGCRSRDFVQHLRRKLIDMQSEVRQRIGRKPYEYDLD